jgi:tRNA-specific 2-thiouridylase
MLHLVAGRTKTARIRASREAAPTRVLVAMSGGVDSAVAAARLVAAGHEVVGVTLHLWDYPDETPEKSRCCAPEDAHDARRVAAHLGIAHYTFDRRELFSETVVEPFVKAYLDGNTPSPCVWCNRSVKMRELFELADRLGAARVATGHYADVREADDGTLALYRGRDEHKDQSYFLYMLTAAELARFELPLGDSTKDEVRAEAIELGLPGAHKGESQELCFVPTGNYSDFVEQRAGGKIRPGRIVDGQGRTLGEHEGIHRFTVGQRRGLGIALGEPAFVVGIDADGASVKVGSRDEILASGALLDAGDWTPGVQLPLRAEVKVRSRQAPEPAIVEAHEGGLRVIFDQPVRAVAPGQIAVAYRGDRVLGGATILAPVASDDLRAESAGPSREALA